MSQDETHEQNLVRVIDSRNQPVLIAADVEDSAIPDRISVREVLARFRQVLPPRGFGDSPPVFERSLRVGMFLPELPQGSFADDMHLVSSTVRHNLIMRLCRQTSSGLSE
jgi:hypothetical protein